MSSSSSSSLQDATLQLLFDKLQPLIDERISQKVQEELNKTLQFYTPATGLVWRHRTIRNKRVRINNSTSSARVIFEDIVDLRSPVECLSPAEFLQCYKPDN